MAAGNCVISDSRTKSIFELRFHRKPSTKSNRQSVWCSILCATKTLSYNIHKSTEVNQIDFLSLFIAHISVTLELAQSNKPDMSLGCAQRQRWRHWIRIQNTLLRKRTKHNIVKHTMPSQGKNNAKYIQIYTHIIYSWNIIKNKINGLELQFVCYKYLLAMSLQLRSTVIRSHCDMLLHTV